MRKKLVSLFLTCSMIAASFSPINTFAMDLKNEPQLEKAEKVIAFPGAEGGGMYSPGARGAIEEGSLMEVYHVTNLNNSGEGSFRDAVSKGNRIVVFDVSGNIDLDSNVTIGKSNMTILGQTAPGDGICFRGNNIKVSGKNVILRYLRFRVGSKDKNGADTKAQDGLEITDNSQNIIIDHCSVSWGTDENLSSYAVKDVTIQWSIIAEALNQSVHEKGEHSYAAIWGGVNLSVHHNIIATHKSRNPKIGTSETVAMTAGYKDDETLVDIRNNIFYNWGDKAGYGAENGAEVNIINNYYKPGPSTPQNKRARIFEYSAGNKYSPNYSGKVYANGNIIGVEDNDPAKSTADIVNENNYQPTLLTGVYPDPKYASLVYENLEKPNLTYFDDYPINTETAEEAYQSVLEDAGARLPKMDIVDQRIVDNVKNRTAPNGSKGSVGLVDDPYDTVPTGSELYDNRGYPIWTPETRPQDYDTDGDGIADYWEDFMGLDKNNPNDSLNIGPSGYTWLEIYVEEVLTKASKDSASLPSATLDTSAQKVIEGENISLSVQPQNGSNIQKVEFYCDDEKIGETSGGTYTLTTNTIKTGEHYATAKVYNSNGEYSFTPLKTLYIIGSQNNSEWIASDTNATYDGKEFIISPEKGQTSYFSKSGITAEAFDFGISIDSISNIVNGAETGVFVEGDVSRISVFKTYDNNKLVIRTKQGENISEFKVPNNAYVNNINLMKVSKNNSEIKIYVAETRANWLEAASVQTSSVTTKDITTGVYVSAPLDSATLSEFSELQFVTQVTHPTVKISNLENNQRIGLSHEIEIEATPDSKSNIVEAAIFLGDNLVKSVVYNPGISEKQTLKIPVSFSAPATGKLRAMVFDGNLGIGEDSLNVSISDNPIPWQVTDIGGTNEDMSSFVTFIQYNDDGPDYTYKISAPDGNISGNNDKFGYMYQQFNDDIRFYYRSRVQSSKNFGIMFKDDLTNDGISYYFGIEPSENGYSYVLKARETKGGEYVTKQTFDNVSGDTNCFIAEKIGNKINIYSTSRASDSTFYKTKVLLGTVETLLKDSYYMGFAATEGNPNPPDAGWTFIESPEKDNQYSYIWNMNYGLDYYWQLQNSKILRPIWTTEAISGNETGKMKITTNGDYDKKSYIFREFGNGNPLLSNDGIIESGFDIFLTGDKTALNFYLQTKEGNQAINVGFDSDDKFVIGGEAVSGLEYSKSKWYNVKVTTKAGTDFAAVKITDLDGNVVLDKGVNTTKFTSINNFKKQPISKGFYIEPAIGISANYYIDNAYVKQSNSSTLELTLAIARISNLDPDEWSALTWINLQNALDKAKEVIANNNASEEEIAKAAEALNKAFEELEPLFDNVITATKFWKFSDKQFTDVASTIGTAQAIDGLQLTGGFGELGSTGNRTFDDGTVFNYRLKSGGGGSATKRSFKFDVTGKTTIKVYAESASGSDTRDVIVDFGGKQPNESKPLEGGKYIVRQFEYTSDEPTTITIYGTQGLNYFGIQYQTSRFVDNRTKISSYNSTSGSAKIFNGSKSNTITAGVVSYDDNNRVVDIKKSNINIPIGSEAEVNIGSVSGGTNTKIFVWESLDNMKPLCDPYIVS